MKEKKILLLLSLFLSLKKKWLLCLQNREWWIRFWTKMSAGRTAHLGGGGGSVEPIEKTPIAQKKGPCPPIITCGNSGRKMDYDALLSRKKYEITAWKKKDQVLHSFYRRAIGPCNTCEDILRWYEEPQEAEKAFSIRASSSVNITFVSCRCVCFFIWHFPPSDFFCVSQMCSGHQKAFNGKAFSNVC